MITIIERKESYYEMELEGYSNYEENGEQKKVPTSHFPNLLCFINQREFKNTVEWDLSKVKVYVVNYIVKFDENGIG